MENNNFLKESLFENNVEKLDIIRKIVYRFSERIVNGTDELLTTGDKEKVIFIVNNILGNHNYASDIRDMNMLSEKGYKINFMPGSAISKINVHPDVINFDIDEIVRLYLNESVMFLTEMKDMVKPTLIKLVNMFNEDKTAKLVTGKSRYDIKLLNNVELFDFLADNGRLGIIGNGEIPANLKLSFPLDSDIEDYRELFVTGDIEIDELTDSMLKSKDDKELKEFWDKYMLNISLENSSLNALYTLHFRKLDDLILLYLALRKILNGGVQFVNSIDSFEKNKVNLSDMINTMVTKYNTFINFNKDIKLVIDFKVDEYDTDIYLSESEYSNYLELGGDIDAIIGFTIKAFKNKSLPFTSKEPVIEDMENLSKYYTEKIRIDKLYDHNRNLTMVTKLWVTYITRILFELDKVKGRLIKLNPYSVEDAIRAYIDNIPQDVIMDTNRVIMDIMYIIDGNVAKFISDMNSISNMDTSNKDNLVKEASFYATINRLTNLLLKDVEAKKVL